MPRPSWESPGPRTAGRPKSASMDPERVNRAVDLLRAGATEAPGPAGKIALVLNGRMESAFVTGCIKAARAQMAGDLTHG